MKSDETKSGVAQKIIINTAVGFIKAACGFHKTRLLLLHTHARALIPECQALDTYRSVRAAGTRIYKTYMIAVMILTPCCQVLSCQQTRLTSGASKTWSTASKPRNRQCQAREAPRTRSRCPGAEQRRPEGCAQSPLESSPPEYIFNTK